jgi:Ca2+-binding RTX toxin-like protein
MSILRLAVNQAQEKLRQFADSSGFMDKLELAFGRGMKRLVAQQLQSAWRQGDFSVIPAIELLPAAVLSPAVGAYASSTDRIYLSQSFLAQPVNNLSLVVDVLLEEIGHRIDCLINVVETPGDEGAIFAGLVQGRSFSEAALQRLRAEDDWGVVELEGQRLAVERAVINGTSNSESLLGTELDDSILGLAGNDSLFGNGGNDLLLDGGDGNDRIDGGDGSDLLYGQLGNDTLMGGLGDDQLYDGQAGIDSIVGGAGIDYLRLDDSNANGNLTVTYTTATNGSITGGNKDGTTFKEIEAIYFIGCTGNDTITLTAATSSAYGYAVEVLGGAGNDSITSGIGADALRGEVGNDTLRASNGADALYGGEGNDYLSGGADNDYLLGSNDFTNQMVGNDTLLGGDGDDGLYDGGAGVDSLDGGTGIDYLSLNNATETANTTVTYTTASSGSISGGSKGGTTFRNIEKIAYVSGSGNDTIDVSAAANSAYVYYPYGRGYYYAADISGGDGCLTTIR